jgi:hypothetical protein
MSYIVLHPQKLEILEDAIVSIPLRQSQITLELVGGGGGGGAGSGPLTPSVTDIVGNGGGGGGSGFRTIQTLRLKEHATVEVKIGTGGLGGTLLVRDGQPGGETVVTVNHSTLTAQGGSGGRGGTDTLGGDGGSGRDGGGGGGANTGTAGAGGSGTFYPGQPGVTAAGFQNPLAVGGLGGENKQVYASATIGNQPQVNNGAGAGGGNGGGKHGGLGGGIAFPDGNFRNSGTQGVLGDGGGGGVGGASVGTNLPNFVLPSVGGNGGNGLVYLIVESWEPALCVPHESCKPSKPCKPCKPHKHKKRCSPKKTPPCHLCL